MPEIRKKRGLGELVAEPLTKRETDAAHALDDMVRRYAAMETQISLLIGRGLNLLESVDGFSKLGYATKAQHAKEELGLRPSYCSQRARMEMLLRERPHLRCLFVTGQVPFSVMRVLLPRTTAVGEEVWAGLIKRKTVEQVKQLLKSFDARVKREQEAETAADDECNPQVEEAGGDDVGRAPGGADGDLAAETLRTLGDLARRCVTTPRGVAVQKPDDESLGDRPGGRWIEWNASPALVAEYDVAFETLRREVGSELSDAECMELIAAEFLAGPGGDALTTSNAWDIGETDDEVPQENPDGRGFDATDESRHENADGCERQATEDPGVPDRRSPHPLPADEADHSKSSVDGRRRAAQQREWTAFWKAARRDLADLTNNWDALNWSPVEAPSHEELAPDEGMSVKEINQRLIQLVAIARRSRTHLRRLLTCMVDGRVYRKLGFTSFEHYVEVRLPMSYDDARLLVRLQRGFFGLELVRQAHDDERLSQSRALLLIEIATPEFESDWIQHALHTTVVHLSDDVRRADRLRSRDSELFAATGGVPELWRAVVRAREGENGNAGHSDDTQGENGTHGHSHDAQGENGTHDHSHDTQGENGTHDCTHGEQGENGTHDCKHGKRRENGTQRRKRHEKSRLPFPTFRENLRLVLGGITCELDEDPFTGVVRRLRFWLPDDMETLFGNACRAALILLGGHGGLAWIMELLLDHFLEQYGQHALDQIRKHPIVARDQARCAVPTCGRRHNLHVHHIVFRSHGGSELAFNKITLCSAHHLHGVHGGRIRVTGAAPDNVEWELGLLPDGNIHMRVVGRTIIHDIPQAA